MSSISLASLASHLPPSSGAKGAHSSSLGASGASSSASASGDTTAVTTNADGSLSVTISNAKGQIVSSSTLQSSGASQTSLLDMLA